MITKHTLDGKERELRSLRQINRNLWRVETVHLFEPANGTPTAVFFLADGTVFRAEFADRAVMWDWVHRRALREAQIWDMWRQQWLVIHEGDQGNYPWKTA